jgi:hypothetical protein
MRKMEQMRKERKEVFSANMLSFTSADHRARQLHGCARRLAAFEHCMLLERVVKARREGLGEDKGRNTVD